MNSKIRDFKSCFSARSHLNTDLPEMQFNSKCKIWKFISNASDDRFRNWGDILLKYSFVI